MKGISTNKQHKDLFFLSSDFDFINKESRLTCWGSSTTVTYSTIFPPPSDTTTEVITHSFQKKKVQACQAGENVAKKNCHGISKNGVSFVVFICFEGMGSYESPMGAYTSHDLIPAIIQSLL